MLASLSNKVARLNWACSSTSLRLLFIAFSLLLPIPIHAQSPISSYAQDFYQRTLRKSTLETLATPAATGAFSNYVTKPAGFGSGNDGLGYHYGVSLADNIQGKFLRTFAFAAASGRHDKYCPLGSAAPFGERIENVMLHSVFSAPHLSRKFNWSALPASLVAAALSNAYQPEQQRSLAATFERFGTNAGGYFFGDLLAEMTFTPKENLTIRLAIGYR